MIRGSPAPAAAIAIQAARSVSTSGCRSTISNRHRAAPGGAYRPCSQSRSVDDALIEVSDDQVGHGLAPALDGMIAMLADQEGSSRCHSTRDTYLALNTS